MLRHMEISDEKFELARSEAEAEYKAVGSVKCPYLNELVHFNNEGFKHLLFKSWNKSRLRTEQYTRLRLLPLAVKAIKLSHTLQEYDKRQLFVRQKGKTWSKTLKTVKYYVFMAIFPNVRIKVIVKHIDGGVPFFYSLYPSWGMKKNNDGSKQKVFISGDPEAD